MKPIIYVSITLLLCVGCDPAPIGNQKEIAEEIDNREIKRVTKAEIMAATSIEVDKLLVELNELTPQDTLAIDSLAKERNVEIAFINLNSPQGTEQSEIADAYRYAIENNLAIESNIEELDNEVMRYTTPINNQDSLIGLWSISLSKKEIIKGIQK